MKCPPPINKIELKRELAKQSLIDRLRSDVFHVTTAAAKEMIYSDGEIRANANREFRNSFMQSERGFYRRINCVSLFDFRAVCDRELEHQLNIFSFLRPELGGSSPVIFVLDQLAYPNILTWVKTRGIRQPQDAAVAHIESGYPDSLSLNLVRECICVTLTP